MTILNFEMRDACGKRLFLHYDDSEHSRIHTLFSLDSSSSNRHSYVIVIVYLFCLFSRTAVAVFFHGSGAEST